MAKDDKDKTYGTLSEEMRTDSLVREQRSLLDQMRNFQRQQARQQFDKSQRTLNDELRRNREDIRGGRRQLAEQAHLSQRQIREGASSRGLGSSGLRNLAALQSQIQQGHATTELERQSTDMSRQAMMQRQSMEENLLTMLMQADANYSEGQLKASQAGRQWAMEDIGLLLDFIEMSREDDEPISEEQLGMLLAMSGFDNVEGGDGGESSMLDMITGAGEEIEEVETGRTGFRGLWGEIARLMDLTAGNTLRLPSGNLRGWHESGTGGDGIGEFMGLLANLQSSRGLTKQEIDSNIEKAGYSGQISGRAGTGGIPVYTVKSTGKSYSTLARAIGAVKDKKQTTKDDGKGKKKKRG